MIKERQKLLRLIKNLKLNRKCLTGKKTIGEYSVGERIGSDSVYGQVYNACYKPDDVCKETVSIKKVPIDRKEYQHIVKKHTNKSSVLTEIKILKFVNELVTMNINPHLPIVFKYFFCDDGFLRTEPQNRDKYIFIVNEIAEGDLSKFLTKVKPDLSYIANAYFQVFTAIYSLKKYFNLQHNDLHWGNVLFQKINNKNKGAKYISYKLSENLTITIKNMGYLFTLWDFGLSYIPGKLTLNDPRKKINWKTDYHRIISMLSLDDEQTSVEYDSFGQDMITILKKSSNELNFLNNIKKMYKLHHTKVQTDYYYDMTKKICFDTKELSSYIDKDMRDC